MILLPGEAAAMEENNTVEIFMGALTGGGSIFSKIFFELVSIYSCQI